MERTISLGMRGGGGWLVYGRGVGSGGGVGEGDRRGVSLRGGAHEGRRRIGSKRGEADRPHPRIVSRCPCSLVARAVVRCDRAQAGHAGGCLCFLSGHQVPWFQNNLT